MNHGILAQVEINQADSSELVYTFTGVAAFTATLINRDSQAEHFTLYHLPQGSILNDKHIIVYEFEVIKSITLPVKYLANVGDQLIVKCSTADASVTLHGVES